MTEHNARRLMRVLESGDEQELADDAIEALASEICMEYGTPPSEPIVLELPQEHLDNLIKSMDEAIERYMELGAAAKYAGAKIAELRRSGLLIDTSKPKELPIYDGT